MLVALAISPWCHRSALRPQSQAAGLCLTLQGHQMRVLACIRCVDPGQTGTHLAAGYIGIATLHIGHAAAIDVFVKHLDARALVQAQLQQIFARLWAKGLAGFGSVNGGNTHFDLVGRKRRSATRSKGVAVADSDDQAQQSSNRHGKKFQKSKKPIKKPGHLQNKPTAVRNDAMTLRRCAYLNWICLVSVADRWRAKSASQGQKNYHKNYSQQSSGCPP